MATVGKILVVLILVFSVVFMGFAAINYTARTNWKAQADKVKKEKQQRDQDVKNLQDQLAKAQQDFDTEKNARLTEIKALDATKADNERTIAQLIKDREVARTEANRNLELVTQGTKEVEARVQEITNLRKLYNQTVAEKDQANKVRMELQDKNNTLQRNLEITNLRTADLEKQVAQLTRIAMDAGLPTSLPEKEILENPPLVEGKVDKVNGDGRLLQISIGSDDGIRKGHKLFIYRTTAQGKYLGQGEVVQVDPDQAVLRVLPQYRQTIQEGDRVATRLDSKQ